MPAPTQKIYPSQERTGTTQRLELLQRVGRGVVHVSRRRGGVLKLIGRTIESPARSRFYPYHERLNPNRGKFRGKTGQADYPLQALALGKRKSQTARSSELSVA